MELKADFFRLRRQFLREEKLRQKMEADEFRRNQTMAFEAAGNSSILNSMQAFNGNSMNGGQSFNQNGGNRRVNGHNTQSYENNNYYSNNGGHGPHHGGEQLQVQPSRLVAAMQPPFNPFYWPKRRIMHHGRPSMNSEVRQGFRLRVIKPHRRLSQM